MKKLFIIGLKDLKLTFRDKAALIMMLLAPFLLTLGLGFVSGRFSSNQGSVISNIPVVIVNQDEGQLGQALVDIFQSRSLAELVTPSVETDPATARQLVDDDQASAAVFIPMGFTQSVIDPKAQADSTTLQIEIYGNPTRPTTAGVIKTIVDEFISRVEVGRVSAEVTVSQLLAGQLIKPQEAMQIAMTIGEQSAATASTNDAISLKTSTNSGAEIQFDVLAYLAPGMALIFLMFTVTNGGRTLLNEKLQGTLPRLQVSPTTSSQILGGKVFGIFLTGLAQMLILIVSSTLFFRLQWGDPLGVLLLVMAAVVAAVGWGLFLTSLVNSPGQVTAFGTAIMLLFSLLGGGFINRQILPGWLKTLGLITPNAWALDGFQTLSLGGGLPDILRPILGLLVMGCVLFAISAFLFTRRGFVKG